MTLLCCLGRTQLKRAKKVFSQVTTLTLHSSDVASIFLMVSKELLAYARQQVLFGTGIILVPPLVVQE